MFLGSDDNMLRCLDVHSGQVLWMKGCDAPIRKSPWTLGGQVAMSAGGAEGVAKTSVESFKGMVFVKNAIGLHAFDATSGEEIFKDANSERPVVIVGDYVVTLGASRNGQLRKGKGLPRRPAGRPRVVRLRPHELEGRGPLRRLRQRHDPRRLAEVTLAAGSPGRG